MHDIIVGRTLLIGRKRRTLSRACVTRDAVRSGWVVKRPVVCFQIVYLKCRRAGLYLNIYVLIFRHRIAFKTEKCKGTTRNQLGWLFLHSYLELSWIEINQSRGEGRLTTGVLFSIWAIYEVKFNCLNAINRRS